MTATTELSEAAEKLLPALEALSETDQKILARRLLAGPTEDPAKVREAWKAELKRRIEEIDSGRVQPEPIEEMFRRSRERRP